MLGMVDKENPPDTNDRLNPKKIAFINAYTELGSQTFHNASASARKAGYSAHSSGAIGHRLLRQSKIDDEIKRRDKETWDWDFDTWSREVLKSASQVDAKHSNRPRYLELIGKSKGFIGENARTTNNLFVLSSSDLEAIREKLTKSNNGTFLEAQTSDNPATKTITIDAKCSDAS